MSKDQAKTKGIHKSSQVHHQSLKLAANVILLPQRRRDQSSYELDKVLSTMHKSYQPLKPAANLLPMKKWEEQQKQVFYEQHLEKVRKAKPVVDTKGLETPAHIKNNLKKAQLQKERMAIIERDNHFLASRLSAIAQQSDYRRELWEADWEKVKERREDIARYPRGESNKKVRKAKPVVDTNGLETPAYLKKAQLQKERMTDRERDSHLLASRLPAIAHSKGLVDKRNDCPKLSVNMQKSDFRRELCEADSEKVKERRDDIKSFPRGESNKQVLSSTMHKSYQPLKPAANLLPMKKWEEQQKQVFYKQHLEKVRKAKPVVDTNGLETPAYLKKAQWQKEKMADRERDSHLLASRLPAITRSKGLVDKRNNFPRLSL